MKRKYIKRPVVIEAIQWDGSNEEEILEWLDQYETSCEQILQDAQLVIPTLEGDHKANIGDFVIKGVNDEFYPCKPDIFEKTYEVIND